MAQSTTFRLKSHHTDGVSTISDETSSISAGDYVPHSHTDDPGGDIDDPGGGSTNDWDFFSNCTTSASTFSKASASYVSSSLTTRVSLLKSAADVVKCTDMDYATGSFCSSCSIPPLMTGGLWSTGKGCAMCDYDYNDNYGG